MIGDPGPPLVGRALELRSIAESREAGGVGFVLAGSSGVGKTRLARAALAEAQQAGAAPLWVQATRSAATIPLGALAGILPEGVSSHDPLTVLRTSAQALTELAGRKQLVLGVDDAQHLDPTSAALVLHLARTSAAFIIVTVCSGEPCPDAIQALWKDAGAQHLALGVLDESQTDQLLEAIVGGPVEAGVRQWIWELSRGNALYVSELLRGLLASGAFRLQDGLWWMSGRPHVPTSLAKLMSARVSGLGDGARRSLELLALGEPLRLSELTRLEPLESLVSAEAEGLITVIEHGRSGPAFGPSALQRGAPGLTPRRAGAQLRLRLAESLQENADADPRGVPARGAVAHRGRRTRPHRLLGDAARAAIATGDPELAGLLAGRAVVDGGGMEAQLLLARSLAARNHFEEAAAALADAEQMVGPPEVGIQPDVAIAYLQQQTEVLFWGLERVADLRALLDRAGTWWPDPSWQRRLDPLRELIGAHLPREGPGASGRRASLLSDATGSDHDRQRAVQTAQLRRLAYDGRSQDAYRLASSSVRRCPSGTSTTKAPRPSGSAFASARARAGMSSSAGVRKRCRRQCGVGPQRGGHSQGSGCRITLRPGTVPDASRWLAEAAALRAP